VTFNSRVTSISPRDLRAAQVANVLAKAVRDGDVEGADAMRILRHELRRRNTNTTLTVRPRSKSAQTSIDKYAPDPPPKNGSDDALHADHVYPLSSQTLQATDTLEQWVAELKRLRTVVCVTAAENYALEFVEKRGVTGPEKYAEAGVEFTTPVSW